MECPPRQKIQWAHQLDTDVDPLSLPAADPALFNASDDGVHDVGQLQELRGPKDELLAFAAQIRPGEADGCLNRQ